MFVGFFSFGVFHLGFYGVWDVIVGLFFSLFFLLLCCWEEEALVRNRVSGICGSGVSWIWYYCDGLMVFWGVGFSGSWMPVD